MDSLSPEDRVIWRTIRKELEAIGITVAAFEANKDFIFRWLSHAIETGAFEEQNILDSEDENWPKSPSTSSDSPAYARSNPPSRNASMEAHPLSEDQNLNLRREELLLFIRTKFENSQDSDTSWPVTPRELPTRLEVPLLTLPVRPGPFVSCERCGNSNIAFELHMRCEQCKDGAYNLCLQCWRRGRGCLNWYGFGQSAITRWSLEGNYPSKHPFPHFLTGCRYQRAVTQNLPMIQGTEVSLAETLDPKSELQLQSGSFCSNCAAFARDAFWVCDVCNDGEWGYCTSCVRRGSCCTHSLLPVSLSASTNSPSMSSVKSKQSETTEQALPLMWRTNCDICTLPIPPTANRFHCPQCDDGDYDVCIACYRGLIEKGHISEANGPRGWRRCLKNHRMIITTFDASGRGQRYIVVRDLVGGHAMNVPDSSPTSGVYPPSGDAGLRVVALWSYWPKEGDDDELAFPKGAEIRECEDINGDWFWGVYCGRKGLFPGNYGKEYVEGVDESHVKGHGLPNRKPLVVTKGQWGWRQT